MEPISKEKISQELDLKTEINKYLIHWKWLLLSIILSCACAFLYLRYTAPLYSAANVVLLKEQNSTGMFSGLASATALGLSSTGTSSVDNEIVVLSSRSLIESTVGRKHLNVNYIVKGKVLDKDLYLNSPIRAQFLNTTPEFSGSTIAFQFLSVSGNRFRINSASDFVQSQKTSFQFGESIPTKYGTLVVSRAVDANGVLIDLDSNSLIDVSVSPIESVAKSFRDRLKITSGKAARVLELGITDYVPERAADFLNALVDSYNENAVRDKNYIANNTSKFISDRLAFITNELGDVEKNVEDFKKSNQLIDIATQSSGYVAGASDYEKEITAIGAQQSLVVSILNFIKKKDRFALLPSNLIEGENSSLISSYNDLILERERLLKSATVNNPSIIKLEQQIVILRSSIMESLLRLQTTLGIKKQGLNAQAGIVTAKIGKIPTQERQFRVIDRQQKIKEALYLFLLQKREETAISLSATEPNVKMIDAARASSVPLSPNRKNIYSIAFLLGLLLPVGIIFLLDFLDTKIKSRMDLEGRSSIPFIGDVPTSETAHEIMQADSRTSSAEALRIIRTNLAFMLSKVPDGVAKTIFLTSTFPKEGKTFVSVNLAATFALSGKKVLLIGMDIRNPRLDDYLTLPDRGFTNYLSSQDLPLDDLIVKQQGYEAFYVLPAGVVPPNPAELLMSKKVDLFFETVKKQYDYIIVDTAPVSLVTDTLLIAHHADTFVYVARANFLEKRMLDIPNGLFKEQKLPNMCLLLNDTDSTKGYGYGYGYGTGASKAATPWYRKKFNF